jgi:hypothetical protein
VVSRQTTFSASIIFSGGSGRGRSLNWLQIFGLVDASL